MLAWNNLVEMLGCSKASNEFIYLPQKLNELPVFEEGVLGDRSYYSFFNSGVLFLLEDDVVNQIIFYTFIQVKCLYLLIVVSQRVFRCWGLLRDLEVEKWICCWDMSIVG